MKMEGKRVRDEMKNVAQPYSRNKRSPVPIQDETHGDKMVPTSPNLVTLTHTDNLPVSGALSCFYLSNLSSGEDWHRVVQVQPGSEGEGGTTEATRLNRCVQNRRCCCLSNVSPL